MKKLMLLAVVAVAMAACGGKETPERTEQTVRASVYWVNEQGEEVEADGSWIALYEDADFDFEASRMSMHENGRMTLTDGRVVGLKYDAETNNGTPVINNVKDGQYLIIVNFGTDPYQHFNFGYRKITVDKSIHNVVQKFVFTDDDITGYIVKHFVEK